MAAQERLSQRATELSQALGTTQQARTALERELLAMKRSQLEMQTGRSQLEEALAKVYSDSREDGEGGWGGRVERVGRGSGEDGEGEWRGWGKRLTVWDCSGGKAVHVHTVSLQSEEERAGLGRQLHDVEETGRRRLEQLQLHMDTAMTEKTAKVCGRGLSSWQHVHVHVYMCLLS